MRIFLFFFVVVVSWSVSLFFLPCFLISVEPLSYMESVMRMFCGDLGRRRCGLLICKYMYPSSRRRQCRSCPTRKTYVTHKESLTVILCFCCMYWNRLFFPYLRHPLSAGSGRYRGLMYVCMHTYVRVGADSRSLAKIPYHCHSHFQLLPRDDRGGKRTTNTKTLLVEP